MLPDLTQIYKTINWHMKDDRKDGEHIGVFAALPVELSKQFPEEGREGEDSSPPHVTIIYMDFMAGKDELFSKVVNDVCSRTKPFKVKLGKPRVFENENFVYHSPVKGKKLVKFHDELENELIGYGLPVSKKYPEFQPHVTIAYCEDKRQLREYKRNVKPMGEWIIDSVWVWGTEEPHLVFLGG